MFKTAASRLAHNTTIPVLGGNQDLRPLQDLITSEKTVIIALQKLSTDYSKAAETLRTWGQTEGDDLGDILSASTTLLLHFSSALSQYAAHGHTIREHLKAIRSREEALDELRRRRRTVHKKADDADKKLHKMSPEHKNLDTQTELLHRLQDEIRTLDSEIMTEEASLGDFKRSTTRTWLGLKFGGLLECAERGTIIGEYGKLLVAEIPEDVTQPGMPRNLYYGHSKINSLVNEATRCVNEVSLSEPGVPRTPLPLPPKEHHTGQYTPMSPVSDYPPQQPGQYPPHINTLPSSMAPRIPALDTPLSGTVDDFGMRNDGIASAKFATFPVKMRQDSLPTHPMPFSSQAPPSLNTRSELGDSFSLSIVEALEGKKDTLGEENAWRGRLSGGEPSPAIAPPTAAETGTNPWATPPGQSQTLDEPKRDRSVSQISDNDDALLAYMTSMDAETSSISDNEGPNQGPDEAGSPKNAEKPFRPVSHKVQVENEDQVSQIKKKQSIPRIPPPVFDPEEGKEDAEKAQRALDAAAARELTRDLDLSGFTPPKINSISPAGDSSTKDEEEQGRSRSNTMDVPSSVGHTTEMTHEVSNESSLSVLAPPSAPFAQRVVSPHPFPAGETQHQPRTAAQAYAQSYHLQDGPSPSANPPTAAQVYAQSFQTSSTPAAPAASPLHQTNVVNNGYPAQDTYRAASPASQLPPRLQALQQPSGESPPRFQGTRTGSSPLPPRFQQQSPPYLDSATQSQDDSRFSGGKYANLPAELEESRSSIETPYRTPMEYPSSAMGSPRLSNPVSSPTPPPASNAPAPAGSPPKSVTTGSPYQAPPAPAWLQASSASGNASPVSGSSSPLATTRTISAAAFKRPQPLPSSSMDSYGGNITLRGLPTSPHPPQQSHLGGGSGVSPAPQQAPAQQQQQSTGSYGTPVGGIFQPPAGYGGSGAPSPLPNTGSPYPYQQQLPPQSQPQSQSPPQQLLPGQPQYRPNHRSRVSRDLPPPPPGAAPARPETEYDYGFDISAYQDGDTGSPLSSEFPAGAGGAGVGAGARRPVSGTLYGGGSAQYQQQGQQGPPPPQYGSGGPPGGAPQPGYGQTGAYGRYDQGLR
ncbi:hypothetical protein D9611_009081 [Ephemerocybe angulata]|uniref:Eisosome component PIL1-domain-containing protein n=1 Tax=Ephemerocybe angulata TaxID=980116 RepID=A0A8H5FK28_9AGAR|nr:hypothetical protein D9611_009081 [Tulosesus angulatus]